MKPAQTLATIAALLIACGALLACTSAAQPLARATAAADGPRIVLRPSGANVVELPAGMHDGDTSFAGRALASLNALRAEAGLAAVAFDPAVARAAAEHAHYLVLHHAAGHDEQPGATGFTGADVTSRLRHHAPVYGGGEVLSVVGGLQDQSIDEAIQQIFASPYHRGAILFDWARAGAAVDISNGDAEGNRQVVTVVDFADIATPLPDTQLVAWPHDGARDVPPVWTDIEQPDPMGEHSGYFGRDVGFPVTLSGGPSAHIVLQSFDLRDEHGQRVPCRIATPDAAAAGRNTAVCTPFTPLDAGIRYSVHAQGLLTQRSFANAAFDLHWSFTTASPAGTATHLAQRN